jgi:hypothetical protein
MRSVVQAGQQFVVIRESVFWLEFWNKSQQSYIYKLAMVASKRVRMETKLRKRFKACVAEVVDTEASFIRHAILQFAKAERKPSQHHFQCFRGIGRCSSGIVIFEGRSTET